jgi:DNA processing protein
MLYTKGSVGLNPKKSVAIIGTRKNTDYGRQVTEDLVEGLKDLDITIISGLAHGIDAIAHRKALECGLPTFAVLAHGLDRIYPVAHKGLAKEIIGQGALITEHISGTNPDKQNFPMRNRIVAAMSDITIVVETDIKGGAMITAKLAASYNRDVAAFPGRATDSRSRGCNYLVKTNIAQLITGVEDLLEMMNWQRDIEKKAVQAKLFDNLSGEELQLVKTLQGRDAVHIDELMLKAGLNSSVLASLLLSLEFQNVIRSMPGKRYALR